VCNFLINYRTYWIINYETGCLLRCELRSTVWISLHSPAPILYLWCYIMHFAKPLYVTCVQWRGCDGIGVRGAPAEQVGVQSLYRNSNCFENFVTPSPSPPTPYPTACTYAEVPSLFHMYVTWMFYKTTINRSFFFVWISCWPNWRLDMLGSMGKKLDCSRI